MALAWPAGASVDSIRELVRAGRFAEAVQQCDTELKASPRSAPLWTLRGLALRGAGDLAGATTSWQQAGDYLPALQALAQTRFDQRDPAAPATLERLLRLNPALTPARSMLATLRYELRDCPGVTQTLAPVTELAPASRWQLGVCQYELGRFAEAAAHFAALLRLREHAPTRFNLALAQWQQRDYRAVAATLASATDVESLRLLAGAHQALGEVPQSLAVLQRGVDLHPADPRFPLDLAALCLEQGNTALGLEVVDAALQRHPDSAELVTLRGVLLARGGDAEKGEAALRQAEQRHPLGRVALASLLMQSGLPAEATKLLDKDAHAAVPDDRAVVTFARAVSQNPALSEQERSDAIAVLRGAVARDPRNAAAQSLLGKLLAQRGDTAGAISALRAALALDANDRSSAYQLMTLYRRQRMTKEASELAARLRAIGESERRTEGERFQLVRADP